MTTTSATSSTATSPLTRKPERRWVSAARRRRGPARTAVFLAHGPCGRRKFAVIPPPSESKARFAPIGAQRFLEIGAIAQLGERFNGIEEVVGSIPSGSTTQLLGFEQPTTVTWNRSHGCAVH
jgi:hypothetical protein